MGRIKKHGKKQKNITVAIFVIILVMVGGYFMYKYSNQIIAMNRVKITYNDNLKAEINDEVVLKTFIKEITNGIILNGDEVVDTSKLGKKELVVSVKNKEENNEKYKFTIEEIGRAHV